MYGGRFVCVGPRAYTDGEICIGELICIPLTKRSYEGLRLHSVAVCPSRARLFFHE